MRIKTGRCSSINLSGVMGSLAPVNGKADD
jgi:hypothetical protein